MTWMNEYDVLDAAERFESADTPNLMHLTQVLRELMRWTNRHSDGWPYWQKPGKAANRLQELIEAKTKEFREGDRYDRDKGGWISPADATDAEVKKVLSPVKAFCTSQQKETSHRDRSKPRMSVEERERILTAGIPKPPTTSEIIFNACHEAGLPVMIQVLGILVDRGREGTEEYVRGLGSDNVEFLYNQYVGPAIDSIEDVEITYLNASRA